MKVIVGVRELISKKTFIRALATIKHETMYVSAIKMQTIIITC